MSSRLLVMAYQILQRISPPIPKARALRSVMIPCDVEITATPFHLILAEVLYGSHKHELQVYLRVQIVLHHALS